MKKLLLLCLMLSACTDLGLTAYDCRRMCEPRMVDHLSKTDGCVCEGGQKVMKP